MIGDKKFGFSLIELMVVMSIIAIITLVGASALFSSRGKAMTDSIAQGFIDSARETQNKALSVQRGNTGGFSGCETKVWGVKVEANSYSILSYRNCSNTGVITDPAVLTEINESTSAIPAGASFTVAGGVTSFPLYISYATPFGKAYVHDTLSGIWSERNSPVKDWEIPDADTVNIDVVLTAHYGTDVRNITIKPNGDVYAK